MSFKCQSFLTFNQVPGVKAGNGLHCRDERLCRVASVAAAPWVFNNDNGSASDCASNCANNCANNLHNDNVDNRVFRGAVFGSLGPLIGQKFCQPVGQSVQALFRQLKFVCFKFAPFLTFRWGGVARSDVICFVTSLQIHYAGNIWVGSPRLAKTPDVQVSRGILS